LAGSIWLITSFYVHSSPKLNTSLSTGKLESAEHGQALSAQLQQLKDKSAPLPDICLQYRLLAIYYFASNNYEKSEDTLLDCLRFLKGQRAPMANYPATYNMLADFWLARADFANADILYKKAKSFCPDHSFVLAKTTNNLGLLYYLWGEATSSPSLRMERLTQSRTFYQTALAQLTGLKEEKVGKEELQFFHKYLMDNYQSCLEELTYTDPKIALLH
jgi:tetratricopeptide (TPR) repeat protein